MRNTKRPLLWLGLTALTAGVLYLIWLIAFVLSREDQAVTGNTTYVVVVRVEPMSADPLPYLLGAAAVVLAALSYWLGRRRRKRHLWQAP